MLKMKWCDVPVEMEVIAIGLMFVMIMILVQRG